MVRGCGSRGSEGGAGASGGGAIGVMDGAVGTPVLR